MNMVTWSFLPLAVKEIFNFSTDIKMSQFSGDNLYHTVMKNVLVTALTVVMLKT